MCFADTTGQQLLEKSLIAYVFDKHNIRILGFPACIVSYYTVFDQFVQHVLATVKNVLIQKLYTTFSVG